MNEFLIGLPFLLIWFLAIALVLTWQNIHYMTKDIRKLEGEVRDLKYKR